MTKQIQMKKSLSFFFLTAISILSSAQAGDTTIVQTFTFDAQNNPNQAYDSPGRQYFTFPNDNTEYQKVLMYYTLKCFEDGTAGNLGFPCGEWDYLTYTNLYQHTGEYDSNYVWHPHYQLNLANFTEANLNTTPIVDTYQYEQTSTIIDVVNSETEFLVGDGFLSSSSIFSGSLTNRAQFIWSASELTASGMTAGDIAKMVMYSGEGSGQFKHLKIRLKASTVNALASWNEDSWTTVYDLDTDIAANSAIEFIFNQPFTWNGTSNILVDISYTNEEQSDAVSLIGTVADASLGIYFSGEDRNILFDSGDQVSVPANAFTSVNDQITISFWVYGTPEFQPEDGTVFEGINASNQRVLNSHLPWSNGRVYWDAGNNGGYDRIDKAASTTQYEGKWNHYAFTKDASTGSMKIFLNGVLWHSGTNLDNVMNDVVKFTIGSASSWTNYYHGGVDEFAVFNVALDATTIADWMRKDIDDTHPYYSNLQFYYSFNAEEPWVNTDNTQNGNDGDLYGNATHPLISGESIFRNAQPTLWKPKTSFYQGDYTTTQNTIIGEQSLQRGPVSLSEYAIVDYQPIVLNTEYYWQGDYSYVYNASGVKIDSTAIVSDYYVENDTLYYYSQPFEIVNKIELGRFITPYGIQLDLGTEGWTWVYDITDFESLLHGEVELEAGNWQELLDLKFVFIEGPTPRKVTRIENVWNGNWNLSNFDTQVTERSFALQDNEVALKLRTVVTGHGFGFDNNNCGEFCYNTHSVKVNGTQQFTWEIMEDCDRNPLYPQGGTWLFTRAGWCPGKEGRVKEFELTPFLQNGEVSADYDITYDPYGNYVTESQMIYYGPIALANDAEIDQITAPSDWKIHSRWNPMCDNPKVVIRNKGSQPLTSLTFTYRVQGGEIQTYEWTGNLAFMESEEVELSYNDPIMWQGDDTEMLRFIVDISGDENNSNNHAESTFYRPPIYHYLNYDDNRMIIILKTNLAYTETSYTLYDINGNVVFSRDNFPEANTTYRDTLQLNSGCYMFHLKDTEGDGLGFFANDDGYGQSRLDKVSGSDFINFEPDFGKEIMHYFYFQTDLVSVTELNKTPLSASIFPNPASDQTMLRLRGFSNEVSIDIYDSNGRKIKMIAEKRRNTEDDIQINTSEFQTGMYFVAVSDCCNISSLKMVIR